MNSYNIIKVFNLPLFIKALSVLLFVHAVTIFLLQQSEISIHNLTIPQVSNIILIMYYIIFKAVVIYGLVSNKRWSMNLALGDACIEIVLYFVITLPQFLHSDLTKPRSASLLIIFLIAYLLLLMELKNNRNSQLK